MTDGSTRLPTKVPHAELPTGGSCPTISLAEEVAGDYADAT